MLGERSGGTRIGTIMEDGKVHITRRDALRVLITGALGVAAACSVIKPENFAPTPENTPYPTNEPDGEVTPTPESPRLRILSDQEKASAFDSLPFDRPEPANPDQYDVFGIKVGDKEALIVAYELSDVEKAKARKNVISLPDGTNVQSAPQLATYTQYMDNLDQNGKPFWVRLVDLPTPGEVDKNGNIVGRIWFYDKNYPFSSELSQENAQIDLSRPVIQKRLNSKGEWELTYLPLIDNRNFANGYRWGDTIVLTLDAEKEPAALKVKANIEAPVEAPKMTLEDWKKVFSGPYTSDAGTTQDLSNVFTEIYTTTYTNPEEIAKLPLESPLIILGADGMITIFANPDVAAEMAKKGDIVLLQNKEKKGPIPDALARIVIRAANAQYLNGNKNIRVRFGEMVWRNLPISANLPLNLIITEVDSNGKLIAPVVERPKFMEISNSVTKESSWPSDEMLDDKYWIDAIIKAGANNLSVFPRDPIEFK